MARTATLNYLKQWTKAGLTILVEADAVDKATVSLNFSQKLRITPIYINNVLQVSRVSF